jgi:hypothetical protein
MVPFSINPKTANIRGSGAHVCFFFDLYNCALGAAVVGSSKEMRSRNLGQGLVSLSL